MLLSALRRACPLSGVRLVARTWCASPVPLLAVALTLPCVFGVAVPRIAFADITIEGDYLTLSNPNISVTLRGPDLVKLTNRITGEQYVSRSGPIDSMMDMPLLQPTGKPMRWTEWRRGKAEGANADAAMLSLNDLTRSAWFTVAVDHETQDIVITLWGDSTKDGVTGIRWGIRGLDLSAGRLIIPAQGGRYLDRDSAPASLEFEYPTQWEAQMVIWQTIKGGFVLYSRDDASYFKKLTMSRHGAFADLGFETEAAAPFAKANGVPQVEWRINAYRGEWTVPAAGYRNLMHFLRPPVKAAGPRTWARTVRTVVTLHGSPSEPALLDALAAKVQAAKTLLYLPDWRSDGYDVNYPNYTPRDWVRSFVEHAHALGFHVMLHTDLPGCSPTSPDYRRVQQYQVKDPLTGALMGWYWDHPESDPNRFAFINPAAREWRDLFIARLRPVVEDVKPDALHLDVSGPMWNDGGGLIDGKNYAQGSAALHRALLTAFPSLVLGGESMNEVISPYNWFAQRWNDGDLPAHPICEFLFGDQVMSYGYLGQPNPDASPAGFLRYFALYEGQGVSPTPVLSSTADLADNRPGMRRLLGAVAAWQSHDLQPDWLSTWGTSRFVWRGADGTSAAIDAAGPTVRMRVGDKTVYRRVHGVDSLVTPDYVVGWPAWDETSVFGLNPAHEYWLEPMPRPSDALHVSKLAPGVQVAEAQVTSDFALFRLDPVEHVVDDLVRELSDARTGTAIDGKETALAHGSVVQAQDATVGGDLRRAIFEHPPWQGGVVGETFAEYEVMVPDSPQAVLAADVGLADSGAKSDGVTFRVTVDGSEVWKEHVKPGAWRAVRAPLSRFSGRLVKLRLITNAGPANDVSFDHGVWSAPRVLGGAETKAGPLAIALPKGVQPAGLGGVLESATVRDARIDIASAPIPATAVIFLKPGVPAPPGTLLLDLPHDAALESDGVAVPGTVYGSGTVGPASCGGVAKQRTLSAHTPDRGQTVISWALKLADAAGQSLAFSAGLADGAKTTGVGFRVAVNGETAWTWSTRDSAWRDGAVDLSPWRGKTVLVQLVTDAEGDNQFDWARWADIEVKGR